MSLHLDKKSIIKKTLQVGAATFLSRSIAIAREILQIKFFGVGALSDAFIVAFRIPNLFRHVFAEGALSASFIPVFVKAIKEGKREEAQGLMTALCGLIQTFIFAMYAVVLLKADWVVACMAPGFSPEQSAYTQLFLKILFPFLAFVSASALLGGALNAVNHFFVPALGPALWNMTYVMSLVLCLWLKLTPTYLCVGVLLGGIVQFCMNMFMYRRKNLSFSAITASSKNLFKQVMTKFFPCLLGVSILEINLIVSGIVASFLPKGSVSILYYASRFMNIPLGVFGVALSNILLPHFSRVVLYAPKRFNFYLLEVAKLVTWVIVPVALVLSFVSEQLFSMIFFLAKKISVEQIVQARWILVIYSVGLVFFCFNKILLSLFYSLKDTRSTTIASGVGAAINGIGDVISLYYGNIYGIAASAVLAGLGSSLISCYFLWKRHGVHFYLSRYARFFSSFFMQLISCSTMFLIVFYSITYLVSFSSGFAYWIVVAICSATTAIVWYLSRSFFKVHLYFLR